MSVFQCRHWVGGEGCGVGGVDGRRWSRGSVGVGLERSWSEGWEKKVPLHIIEQKVCFSNRGSEQNLPWNTRCYSCMPLV